MDKNEPNRRWSAQAVVVSLLLLLLPLLYIGGYLLLVVPKGRLVPVVSYLGEQPVQGILVHRYRVGGDWPSIVFMPLELIDRAVRPEAWDSGWKEEREEGSPPP